MREMQIARDGNEVQLPLHSVPFRRRAVWCTDPPKIVGPRCPGLGSAVPQK